MAKTLPRLRITGTSWLLLSNCRTWTLPASVHSSNTLAELLPEQLSNIQ